MDKRGTVCGTWKTMDMLDQYGRKIDYLRISITDRCNLRCIYCMPENGIFPIEHEHILRFEEITRLVRIMTGLGVKHIRLTGGEPMARRGCLDLAESLHAVPGIESISMTSNGILLKDKIEEFRSRGANVAYGAFGENLVVEGIDFRTLPVGILLRCKTLITISAPKNR